MALLRKGKILLICNSAAITVGLLFLLMPGSLLPEIYLPGFDKLAHFTLFFMLTWEIMLLIARSVDNSKIKWNYAIIIVFVVLLGAVSEIYQSLVPGRNMDFSDFVFDVIGGFVGIFSFRLFGSKLSVHERSK